MKRHPEVSLSGVHSIGMCI